LQQISIATGERDYSGTGRNARVTRIVADTDNYKSIPIDMNPTKTSGMAMKLCGNGNQFLSSYWGYFEKRSRYNVTLDVKNPIIKTKSGDKTVGSIFMNKESGGFVVLLPDLDFNSEYYYTSGDRATYWSKQGKEFCANLINELVAIDKALRSSSEITPEPHWVNDSKYSLREEISLRAKLIKIEGSINQKLEEKSRYISKISEVTKLKRLLFEKGKPLEEAIIDALVILGFSASSYRDDSSEFDVVFESKEGRLIGEAEGKDNKPVAIDKLRQLAMNIHEDLEREEVLSPAKGVLFGNPFRLKPFEERGEPFTEKCKSAAASSSVALVSTPDLFSVVRYLSNKSDARFARRCRKALLDAVGLVNFPALPDAVTDVVVDKSGQSAGA